MKRFLVIRSPRFTVAAFLLVVAYGISFPIIAIRLNETDVAGFWVGLNAAMPPLGWIVGSALLPLLQITLGIPFRRLIQLFLAISVICWLGLQYAESYWVMTALRFGFGGAIGVAIRCIEYWINVASQNEERGRNISIYSVLFMIALIIGSSLQPFFGSTGWEAFAPPLILLVAALILLQLWSGDPAPRIDQPVSLKHLSVVFAVPIALLAVLSYGLFESVPTTLMEIYVLRNGLDTAIAAYSLSAAALGNVLFQYPVAALSDRIGRIVPIVGCAIVAAVTSAAIPFTLSNPTLLLFTISIWGGAAATIYSTALAMIGDRYTGSQLVLANAAFGVVYAASSVIGPILNGYAISQFNTHGLMISLFSIFATLTVLMVSMRLFVMREARP